MQQLLPNASGEEDNVEYPSKSGDEDDDASEEPAMGLMCLGNNEKKTT